MKNNVNSTMISFRDSFKGYNKDDVNKYLREMNSSFMQSEDDYRAEIDELKEKLKKYESKPASSENAKSNEDFQKLTAELEGIKAELEKEKAENTELKANLSANEKKFEELSKSDESADEKLQKANLYDKMSNEIGNVLITANDSAQALVREANISAAKIKNDATTDAENLRRDTQQRINEAIDSVKAQLECISKKYVESYTNISDELLSSINSMFNRSFSDYDAKLQSTQIKLDSLKAEADKLIENAIKKI